MATVHYRQMMVDDLQVFYRKEEGEVIAEHIIRFLTARRVA